MLKSQRTIYIFISLVIDVRVCVCVCKGGGGGGEVTQQKSVFLVEYHSRNVEQLKEKGRPERGRSDKSVSCASNRKVPARIRTFIFRRLFQFPCVARLLPSILCSCISRSLYIYMPGWSNFFNLKAT